MEQQKKNIVRQRKSAITGKLITIGVITAVLMVVAGSIRGLIYERESLQTNATEDISSSWGCAQTVTGPIISVPLIERVEQIDSNKKVSYRFSRRIVNILPSELKISGTVKPEIRERGIYKVALYNGNLIGTAHFNAPEFEKLKLTTEKILWNEAWISLGVNDVKGITRKAVLTMNGKPLAAEPGIRRKDVVETGFTFPFTAEIPAKADGSFDIAFDLNVNGSGSLNFIPLGDETAVSLTSSWPSPGFCGAVLPKEHEIQDSGFTASWSVLNFNRDYPQIWLEDAFEVSASSFGVNLVQTVDGYQLVTRSVKYALLFIVLTFTGFFLIETFRRCRLHPIQYTLVGSAQTVFYILLLSLSEQTGFAIAYLVASIAIILMITLYTAAILRKKGPAVIMGFVLTLLYSVLYILLQLEEYSLLLGSVVLVIVLAGIMFGTRNVDWFSVGRSSNEEELEEM